MRKTQISLIPGLILVLIIINLVSAVSIDSTSPSQMECLMNGGTWNEGVGFSACSYPDRLFQMVQQPPEQNLGGGITSFNEYQPKEKTQEQRDCEKHGCYEDLGNKCYQFGYIRNGTYCSEKGKFITQGLYKPAFINQSETGSSCIQGYECMTGICSNNLCVNLAEQQNQINLLSDNLSKLSQETTGLFESLNNSEPESPQIPEKNDNLIQKIANLLKTWFGI